MIRDGHRTVADLCREHFGQQRRNRAVGQRGQHAEAAQQCDDADNRAKAGGLCLEVVAALLEHNLQRGLRRSRVTGEISGHRLSADGHRKRIAFFDFVFDAQRRKTGERASALGGLHVGEGIIFALGPAHHNWRGARAFRQARIGQRSQAPEYREEEEQRCQRTDDERFLAPHAVRPFADEDVEAHRDETGNQHNPFGKLRIHPHGSTKEGQAVKEGRVPNDRQHARNTEQRDEDAALVAGIGEALEEGVAGRLASLLHRLEHGAFGQFQTHPQRNHEQENGKQERHTPSPGCEIVFRDEQAAGDHDDNRQHKPADDAGLDEAGVEAALFGRGMLGHINGSAAIFTSESQALHDAQENDDNRRGDADSRDRWNEAYTRRRDAHQRYGDEEGIFSPQPVAEEAKKDCADGPEGEADCESRPDEQQAQHLVIDIVEGVFQDVGKRAVDKEIIPFEDGARAARADDETDFLVRWLPLQGCFACHCPSTPVSYGFCGSDLAFLLAGRKRVERSLPRQEYRPVTGRIIARGCDEVEVGPVGLRCTAAEPRGNRIAAGGDLLPCFTLAVAGKYGSGGLSDSAGSHLQSEARATLFKRYSERAPAGARASFSDIGRIGPERISRQLDRKREHLRRVQGCLRLPAHSAAASASSASRSAACSPSRRARRCARTSTREREPASTSS